MSGTENRNIRTRFAITFLANAVRSLLNFATGLVVARALGPERYGDVIFLLGSFEAIRQAVSMGTDSAFFTFISRRERGSGFISAYWGWQLLQFTLTVAAVAVLMPAKWFELIWLGQDRGIVLLACAAVFCQSQAWQAAMQIGEARRLTVRVQAINMAVAMAHFALVATVAWVGGLSVWLLLSFLIAEYLLALSAAYFLLRSRDADTSRQSRQWQLREWVSEYAVYCAPLFFYFIGSFLFEFSNKWLLQHFGGAQQQAMFAVASQFSAACLLATTSMVRILWKEAAELHQQGDHAELQRLYEKTSRMLYGFAAVIGGFLWPWSAIIVATVLGENYREAWIPLAIMFLYPMHQALGQVMQTLFLALGNTVSYFWIGMAFMVVSVPITYLVLAPASAGAGMGLGALGMALKTLILNAIFVNVYIWYLCRKQQWQLNLGYQAVVLAWSAFAGGSTYWLVTHLPITAALPVAAQVLLGGLIYGLLQLGFLFRLPGLFGISPEMLAKFVRFAANRN